MKFFKKIKNIKGGFTLIELLVVISIISLLSSIVISSLNSARAKARDAQRMSDLNQLQTAIEMYISDHGSAPEVMSGKGGTYHPRGVSTFAEVEWDKLKTFLVPNYIPKMPVDPLGYGAGDYRYAYSSPSDAVDIDKYGSGYGLEATLENQRNKSTSFIIGNTGPAGSF